MSHFASILRELRELELRLKATANRLWTIKLALATAREQGRGTQDFLPRRLERLEREWQEEFEKLVTRLHRVVSQRLECSLIAFSSAEDVETVARISKTIRYIHNSFAGELVLGRTWVRLRSALPAYSNN